MKKPQLTALLNSAPNPKNIRSRSLGGGNFQYIPVGILENMLDEVFGAFGWETNDFQYTQIANEVTGQVTLRVLIDGHWINRIGAASVQVRCKRGTGEKIANALEMDMPHLLSDCFTNACKKLGKYFGRDLNREHAREYNALQVENLDNRKVLEPDTDLFTRIQAGLLAKTVTVEALHKLYKISTETEKLLNDAIK